jgi:hypothetical protein
MRGFPLLNLLAALLICGAVILPLVYRATEASRVPRTLLESDQPATAPSATPVINTHVSLRFVHVPEKIVLNCNDQPLLTKESPGALSVEDTIELPVAEGRAELQALITWPDGTPYTVVELKLEPDGLAGRNANVWSTGTTADEIVTFSWREPAP